MVQQVRAVLHYQGLSVAGFKSCLMNAETVWFTLAKYFHDLLQELSKKEHKPGFVWVCVPKPIFEVCLGHDALKNLVIARDVVGYSGCAYSLDLTVFRVSVDQLACTLRVFQQAMVKWSELLQGVPLNDSGPSRLFTRVWGRYSTGEQVKLLDTNMPFEAVELIDACCKGNFYFRFKLGSLSQKAIRLYLSKQ